MRSLTFNFRYNLFKKKIVYAFGGFYNIWEMWVRVKISDSKILEWLMFRI